MDKADYLINLVVPKSFNYIIEEDNQKDFYLMESNLEIDNKNQMLEKFTNTSKSYLNQLIESKNEELFTVKAKHFVLENTIRLTGNTLSQIELEKLNLELSSIEQDIDDATKEYKALRDLKNKF